MDVQSRAVTRVREVVSRYGVDAIEYLARIRDKWLEYKSSFKCYECGSTNIKWIDDFTYECDKGHRGRLLGLESWEFEVPPWFMSVLQSKGLVQVLYRSRSSTMYGVPEEVLRAIETVIPGAIPEEEEPVETIEAEKRPLPEPTPEIFSDIVGLDDVKDILLKALKADKPVHVLIVGGPATAKTMILEALSRFYDVPIILAGASTRAGLRDYIVENVPEIMLIDELDKVENPLDLSVLLTWMESQKLTVTMVTKKAYVKCPTVCKVIAAANTTKRIPPELLSRFIVINLKPYTDEEVKAICINVLRNREGCSEELATKIADAVVGKLKSKDPRDCVKVARLVKSPEEVDKVVDILVKRR
jgi:Holliday junction DNA helicase RuvB